MKNQNHFFLQWSLLFSIIFFVNGCTSPELTTDPAKMPVLVTALSVTKITGISAECGGVITDDKGLAVSDRGICWSTNQNPTIADSTSKGGTGKGSFTCVMRNLIPLTLYHVRAYATNAAGTSYGSELEFTTLTPPIKDIDGNEYHSITLGTQTWMVENLKTTKYNDGTTINIISSDIDGNNTGSYCWFKYDISKKNTYGAYYNWYAVNTGKLAPKGWHIPSDAEWTVLENYLIANGYNYDGTKTENKIAKALAAKTGWEASTFTGTVGCDLSKNNSTGFTGLAGASRSSGWMYWFMVDAGYSASWWTSTEADNGNAWYRELGINSGYGLNRYSNQKLDNRTVRCIKD